MLLTEKYCFELDIMHLLFNLIPKNKVQTLINSNNKIYTIILAYALKLGLKACYNNVEAAKLITLFSKF